MARLECERINVARLAARPTSAESARRAQCIQVPLGAAGPQDLVLWPCGAAFWCPKSWHAGPVGLTMAHGSSPPMWRRRPSCRCKVESVSTPRA